MKILVNNTELEVLNCYPYRYPNGKLILKVEVLQDVISHDDLRALLKGNTGDITVMKDDGTTEVVSGFYHQVRVADDLLEDGTEIHSCEVECKSENEYQLGILQRTVAEQNAVIEAQNQTIAAQADENALLTECVLEISSIIYG